MVRIGYGRCVGRVIEKQDKFLVLAGVQVPWRVGLLPSGACQHDVLSLAAAQALVGAMGLGSLETCGADLDPRAVEGLEVLRRTAALLAKNGWHLANFDIQLVIQDIQLASVVPQLQAKLCSALGCPAASVNLKIDNERCLGYTGAGQGINATAVCLIEN